MSLFVRPFEPKPDVMLLAGSIELEAFQYFAC